MSACGPCCEPTALPFDDFRLQEKRLPARRQPSCLARRSSIRCRARSDLLGADTRIGGASFSSAPTSGRSSATPRWPSATNARWPTSPNSRSRPSPALRCTARAPRATWCVKPAPARTPLRPPSPLGKLYLVIHAGLGGRLSNACQKEPPGPRVGRNLQSPQHPPFSDTLPSRHTRRIAYTVSIRHLTVRFDSSACQSFSPRRAARPRGGCSFLPTT
jgi:hypothetical protein